MGSFLLTSIKDETLTWFSRTTPNVASDKMVIVLSSAMQRAINGVRAPSVTTSGKNEGQ